MRTRDRHSQMEVTLTDDGKKAKRPTKPTAAGYNEIGIDQMMWVDKGLGCPMVQEMKTTHVLSRKTDPRPPPTSDAIASGRGSGPGVLVRRRQSTFREGELRSKSMSHALFSGLSVSSFACDRGVGSKEVWR
jgi:hypothetical protein